MGTTAVFLPFDLFGRGGTRHGAELLADALREMLADNKREKMPTRARAYQGCVTIREIEFEKLDDYRDWRADGRRLFRRLRERDEFVLWITGNHLGVLPIYDELAKAGSEALVVQFDAHLDVYNLTDCTAELSHGNFLLHAEQPLPPIVGVGSRDLLLTPEHVAKYYSQVFPAQTVHADCANVLGAVRKAARSARHVFLDIDCDVFDPAYFPATSHPVPFGLSPAQVLRGIEAAWSKKVLGVALSEFDPGRDRDDRSLSTLVWLLEHLLLQRAAE